MFFLRTDMSGIQLFFSTVFLTLKKAYIPETSVHSGRFYILDWKPISYLRVTRLVRVTKPVSRILSRSGGEVGKEPGNEVDLAPSISAAVHKHFRWTENLPCEATTSAGER